MNGVYDAVDKVFRATQSFGLQEWGVIAVMTVVLGYMLLRGSGIR